ncbi:MAG: thiamine pyrophosphate-dependent enzyme [Armatimonadota bacterium]|nr:thiamine pyrophosphate-dependent enzyme [Armatimonadota bacterium]MDR7518860.1 thiamine pyrophosphate-dependent enzyme [Armatimonadota bacterium]MDR7549089.1 thiamine pyrophosphate-dependent enzyme [Armatimonadota bacterium]
MDSVTVYTPDFLRCLSADMLLIRRFEARAAQLRLAGHIPGFLHPSIGQEAVAVGACAALESQDYITSTRRGHGHILGRAAAYAMPGVVADGNDILDVFRVVGKAVADARQGRGSTLVECKTYRLRGHYEGDMGHYRPPDEVAAWQARGPVVTFRERLLAEAGLTAADLEEVERAVEARLAAGVRFALEAPRPAADEALEDVFVETHDGSALA